MTSSDSTIVTPKLAISTKPMSVRRSFAFESSGFAAAELASMGVSLGVVAVADKLIPDAIMRKTTDVVAKFCVEPYLDTIEGAMSKCKLKECQVDESKTRHERACRLAHGAIVFGTAYAVSMLAKLGVRSKINSTLGVAGDDHIPAPAHYNWVQKKLHNLNPKNWSPDTRLVVLSDEVMHLGSLVYLNTKASDITDRNIDTMSHALQKMGVNANKAKDISTMAMVWEVPNFLGMMAGGTAILGKHAYGWPKEHKYQKVADIINGKAMSAHSHTP